MIGDGESASALGREYATGVYGIGRGVVSMFFTHSASMYSRFAGSEKVNAGIVAFAPFEVAPSGACRQL